MPTLVPELEYHKVCVVSTAHICYEDMKILVRMATEREPLIVDEYVYGYRVYISPDDFMTHDHEIWRGQGVSKEFLIVLAVAWSQNARWVEFDQDGTQYDHFSVFDWDKEKKDDG